MLTEPTWFAEHRLTWVLPSGQSGDPEDDSLYLLMLLGPLIRDAGNPRGVADPEGKLAKLEAILAEERRRGKS